MNEITNLVGCTQRRKGTNQGGWPQAGHSIFTRRYAGSPYGWRLGMFSNQKSKTAFQTIFSNALESVDKIKSWQLHNPFIDSQTSWYFLLTTTEIPIIIPGSAHPCWILATTKNLKSHLISWYIISLWLLSNGRLLDETIFKISSAHERPNCVYSKLEDFDASIVSHFHTLPYVQWPISKRHQSSM